MKCPFCSFLESKVTDSRTAPETNSIRRRRECLGCLKRFTTFESVDLTVQVRKRDGSYEDFVLEKLVRGLDAACRRTKVSHEQVLAISAEIASQVAERQREIDSTEIGEIVMTKLKSLDTVAYIRFACVYRRFKDMDELMNVINTAQFAVKEN
ncbi:MAG: transcriptional repressor NrdR [Chlamydiae bacterium]|jgi:transcriptional repressor NrdR|nr:transcriptional repressor NrdR [Chlamydiota bacterium]